MKKISKHYKKIILALSFWFFIGILFLAVTTLLVLWASGYKYNFLAHKFQKTGIIYLNSEPKNVKIYINNKLVKERTPAKIGYILPGRYKVEIKKNGCQDWVQEIEVEAEKVKKFENIILFYQNPKESEIAKNVQTFYLSPDRTKILYQSNKFYIYDLKNLQYLPIEGSGLEFVSWSDNSQKILLKNHNDFYYYDLATSTMNPINLSSFLTYSKILWQPNSDEKFLILKENNLYSADIKGNSNLLSTGVFNFAISNSDLYFTTLSNNKEFLKKTDLNFKNIDDILIFENIGWQIIAKNSYLFLKNSKNDFYQLAGKNLQEINSQVQLFSWSENISFGGLIKKIRLVYKTNLDDVYIFDPQTNYNEFVYRTLSPIEKIRWYPDLNHLIFKNNSEIKIIETIGKNENQIATGKDFELLSDKKMIILDQNNNLKILQIKE